MTARRNTRSSVQAALEAAKEEIYAPIPITPGAIFNLIRTRPYQEIMSRLKNEPWNIHETIAATTPRWGNQNIIFSCVIRTADKGDHLALLRYLHSADVPMDLKDVNGQTALFFACKNGLTDCVEYLLVLGKNDPNERDSFGESALFYAVRYGHTETVKLLLKNGAEVGAAENSSKNTPLHEAVTALCFECRVPRRPISLDFAVIRALLDHSSDVNEKNALDETPLFAAVRAGNQPLVDMLMGEYDADALLRNSDDKSVVAFCTAGTELFDMLVENREAKKFTWNMMGHKRSFEEAFGAEDVPMTEEEAAAMVAKKAKKTVAPAYVAPPAPPSPTKSAKMLPKKVEEPQSRKIGKKGKKGKKDEMAAPAPKPAEKSKVAEKTKVDYQSLFELVECAPMESFQRAFEVEKEDFMHMDHTQGNLVHAAAKRHTDALAAIQYLVGLGVPANFCDFCEWTPLFHAVAKNNHDCIEFLVEKECDPNSRDNSELTPLVHAVEQGQTEAVKILHALDANASVKRPIGGDSLTHIAAAKGFHDIVDFLLEKDDGSALEYDAQGYTPLHLAKTAACVNVLLKYNVSVQQVDRFGVPAIFVHIRHGRAGSVEALLAKDCSPEVTDMDGRTCLIAAVDANRPELCSLLLEHNAELKATDNNGNTAETLATAQRFLEICRIFKAENDRRQAIQDEQDRNDINLKKSVSYSNPLPQIRLWIAKYRASPQRLWEEKKESLLFSAAGRTTADVCDVMRFFMDDHGLRADFVDLHGETALFKAVRNLKHGVVVAQLLLDRKCDALQVSNEHSSAPGEMALFEAVRQSNTGCIELLLDHDPENVAVKHVNGADENVLFAARTPDIVQQLLEAGADATLVNKHNRTCLFGVCDVDTAKLLLESTCGVASVDTSGETCLFNAVTSNQGRALIDLLRTNGANLAQINNAGQTCLHKAAEHGNEEVCRMLVEDCNLDPFLTDCNGRYPMQIAKGQDMSNFTQFVEERQQRIKEEEEKRMQSSRELMQLLHTDVISLDEVKTFVLEHSPSFAFREEGRNKHTLIFKAVHQRDGMRTDEEAYQLVQYLLDCKVDATVRDTNSQTALYYACRYLGPRTCKLLVEYECNVNDCDLMKGSPLSYAAVSTQADKMAVVEFLLSAKADPNVVNFKNETELTKAVENNDIPMVQALVKHGANVNSKDSKTNRTPLFSASSSSDSAAMEFLLSNGADVNVTDAENATPLFVCSAQNVAALIEAGANVNHEANDEKNAFFFCTSGAKVDALVKAGCNLAKLDSLGKTCLFTTIEVSPPRPEVYRRLVDDYNLDPFKPDKQEHSCVDIAHARGDRVDFLVMVEGLKRRLRELESVLRNGTLEDLSKLNTKVNLARTDSSNGRNFGFIVAGRSPTLSDTVEMMQKLQEFGCDFTDLDLTGRTAFFTAAQSGNIKAMQYLMVVQCNVGEVDKNQQTPLFAAARGGDVESLQFLVENYANKDARSEVLQETILFEAIRSGKEEMIKAVLDFSKDPVADLNQENVKHSTPLIEAMRQDKLSLIELVIDRGAEIDKIVGPDRKTALFHCQSPTTCLALIEKKAEVNKTDALGRTALFDAVINLNVPLVDMLIKSKAGVNVRDLQGRSPIFNCVEEEEQNEVLQMLLDSGAKVDLRDKAHQTPVTLAKSSKKRKNVMNFVTSLKKKQVIKQASSRGRARDTAWSVRLAPKRHVDGRLEHCVVTFFDKDNPDVILPYGSDEYKSEYWKLKRDHQNLLGLLEYPVGTPWTTGT